MASAATTRDFYKRLKGNNGSERNRKKSTTVVDDSSRKFVWQVASAPRAISAQFAVEPVCFVDNCNLLPVTPIWARHHDHNERYTVSGICHDKVLQHGLTAASIDVYYRP